MKFLIIFASLLAAALAAPERIVGGQETTIEKHPSIVQVEFFSSAWYKACSGNILTSTLAVTVAHCFTGFGLTVTSRVRAGSAYAESGGTVHNVERYLIHPEYDPNDRDFDIVLLYLSEPLVFSDVVQPNTILAQGSEIPDNALVTHAGWGDLYFFGPRPTTLHDVDVYTVNSEICQEQYSAHPLNALFNFQITPRMLCSGIVNEGGKGTCHGDSGGPLFYQGILVGIVSWGVDCASPLNPGVNVKVSAYTDWIVANNV